MSLGIFQKRNPRRMNNFHQCTVEDGPKIEAGSTPARLWDAPLVDWRATLRQQARIRKLPPAHRLVYDAGTRTLAGMDARET